MCVHFCLSARVCFLVCFRQRKKFCAEEKEEAEERCKSETASKQPAVATASVNLPASLPLLPCLPPLLFIPALKQTHSDCAAKLPKNSFSKLPGFKSLLSFFVPKLIIESTIAM